MRAARFRNRRRLRQLLAGLAVAAAATLTSWALPQSHLLQGWLIDSTAAARAMAFGIRPLDQARVIVVTLGGRSLDSEELFNTPRALFSPIWAALAEKALRAGARTITYDFILAYDAGRLEIDGKTPLGELDHDFLTLLRDHGQDGRIVLGRSESILPARRFRHALGMEGLGLIETPVGPGNAVREIAFSLSTDHGGILPSLAERALRGAEIMAPPSTYIVPQAPLSTLPSVELIDVLNCDDPGSLAALFKGRLVFVGSTLAGEDRIRGPDWLIPGADDAPMRIDFRDRVDGGPVVRDAGRALQRDSQGTSPCTLMPDDVRAWQGGGVPGVFLHAAAADAVLSGWAPLPVPLWLRLALVSVAAMAGVALGVRAQLRWAVAAIASLLLVLFAAGVVLFERGWLLDSADPLMAAPAFFAIGWAARITVLDRRARAIRRDFGRYLAPALVERMIEQEQAPRLGGESREVTVMFADLSGFTRLTAELPERELLATLNEYLDVCVRIVEAHGGYVDKFIGDAVMAVWNAPADLADHALHAVKAGLEMARAVDEIGGAIGNRAGTDGSPGQGPILKVAINTGPALVGNVGSRERMNYTVIGTTVNLAARLEDIPRRFGCDVIMGEQTARGVERDFVLLPVASVSLAGISRPVEIFSPLVPASGATAELHAQVADYARARQLAEAGKSSAAAEIWQRLATADWPGAGPSAAMLQQMACSGETAEENPGGVGQSPDTGI